MLGFQIVRIDGHSMTPDLPDGSYALFRRARQYRVGDVVLAQHPILGEIVKRIARRADDGFSLSGTDSRSTAEEAIGVVGSSAIRSKYLATLFIPKR